MRRVIGFAAVVAVCLLGATAPAGGVGVISMESVDGAGGPLHKVNDVSISNDGRYVAFIANGDGLRNVLLRDRVTGSTVEVWPSFAFVPHVSGDGSTVVFQAGYESIMAYDVATQTTSPVHTGASGSSSSLGSVSDDGRFVVFSHRSLSQSINAVYLRDRVATTTTEVSGVNATLSAGNFGPGPVSNDGNTVVFSAEASIPTNPFRTRQIFYWQRNGVQGGIASVNSSNVAANRDSAPNDMTPDGRYIAFETNAALTPADPNSNERDLYVRDVVAGTTSFVGANFGDDDPRMGPNTGASISDDGTKVAFTTNAYIGGKWTSAPDVVLADRQAGTIEVVSLDRNGSPAGDSAGADLSGDARFVSFVSWSRNLVAPFSTSECMEWVEDENENQVPGYTECRNAYVADRAATGAFLPATGGTVSSGSTSVFVPNLGSPSTVSIAPAFGPQPVPDGYEILGQQLVIEGPVATWDNPLRLTFTVDSSLGVAPNDIAVIRDGVPMVDCIGSLTALADGSPCITSRTTNAEDDSVIVALTPHFSVWTVAKAPPPSGPDVTFASLCEATQAATGQKGIGQSLCAKLAAASASRDRGDGSSAAKQLDAYRAEIAAQSGKALTAAQAATLTDQSRLL